MGDSRKHTYSTTFQFLRSQSSENLNTFKFAINTR